MESPVTRIRHPSKRRKLTVRSKANLTPAMVRVVFEGDDLSDFVSLSPDDHVKLFLPVSNGEPERRDYTPRYFDRIGKTLTIDFALHDAGPATHWAMNARLGDVLEVGGPRGSTVVSPIFDWWLLIGDETALPAIGRRLEELPASTRVTTIAAVSSLREEQSFTRRAQHELLWIHRPLEKAADAAPMLEALRSLSLSDGMGFVWIAAEAGVARAVRDYLVNVRHHPLHHIKAAGYWCNGVANTHDKL